MELSKFNLYRSAGVVCFVWNIWLVSSSASVVGRWDHNLNLLGSNLQFLPAAKRQVKCWCRFINFARRRLLLLFCYFCLCDWSLEYFQLVPLYGCLWTCLDPSNHIWDNLDPGAKFWVQGPFGPKFKNCNFLTKPHKMSVYEITWTPPAIILGWFGPWGQLLGPRALCQVLVFQLYSFLIWIVDQHPIYL